MASRNTSTNARQNVQRSNRDSARWIAGLLVLCLGLFAAAAVFFSFFSWDADQSVLQKTAEDRELLGAEIENPCGPLGARLGRLLVDNSFGLFGILIPVMLILIGLRIIRQQPLRLNQSILSLFLVMILGSMTLGFLLDTRWELCSSTGLGGAFGNLMASRRPFGETPAIGLLPGAIGSLGTLILLVGGWILTGVFINRNFINKVNRAGNVLVDQSEKIVDTVRSKVIHPRGGEDTPLDGPTPLADAAANGVRGAEAGGGTEPSEHRPVGLQVERPAVQRAGDPEGAGPVPVSPRTGVQRPAAEDPFVELLPDGTPVGEAAERASAAGAVVDEEFTEVDLARPEGRVVMGRGGLVELERPAQRVPAGGRRTADPDDPFIEITVGDDVPEAAQSASEAENSPSGAAEPFVEEGVPGAASGEPEASGADGAEGPAFAETGTGAPAAAPEGLVVTVEEHAAKLVDAKSIPTESYDPLKDLVNYRKPPVTLLEDYISDSEVSDEEIFENKTKIEETLKYFGIPIQRIKATVGPTVTLYEIVQAQGVKISKIQGLQNDIAQSLKAESGIRIIAPIPGRGTIGIEVPNRNKQVVSMYSAVRSLRFQESKAELPVVIGRTIQNENYVFDLTKMPHLLVAGATGQGKSVGLNAIITSLLYRKHPAQLKFVMIDPKMVEFSLYARIERHFLAKMQSEEEAIVTDPKKAVYTLNALCTEMDTRLELCKRAGARNIAEYNAKFVARQLNPMNGHRYLPYIVVVIDEFADLIMTAKEVETPVTRLAQKARAIGIHLIIATQRPSVDVITGKIKANFPARIAFRVMQMIDSRTIIDRPGADQLIGRGDMLISKDGELTRIQCALVETREVERITDYISKQQGYTEAYALPDYTPDSNDGVQMGSEESSAPVKYDSLFAEIARDAVSSGQISTSMIQRNYEVGFNRAGRIMTQLERAGIVGRQQGAKPRDILFYDLPSLEAKLQELGVS